ncbi:MAG: hypothetical protein QOD74_2382 [Variibacter sp.]|jgi:hypothetical protein|nr:hypothetical protein [Variibacter sp.]
MMKQVEDFQKLGKEGVEASVQSFTAVSRGAQAILVEAADYSRKSFEQGTSAFEKLLGARTFDRALEVQSEFAKTAYEGFVAQTTKFGELYSTVAKDSYKPFEGYIGKLTPTA